jgi:hypothetical protein
MVVPVDNRSYMKRATDRAKTRKKKNNNLGSVPSKLEDNTAINTSRSLATTLLGNPSGKLIDQNKDNPQITKMGGYEPVDPTDAPKQTLLQKQKREADKIIAGGLARGQKRKDQAQKIKDQGMIGPSAGNTPKPLAPKPAASRPSPHPDIVKPKPVKTKPKMAPKPKPNPRRSSKPSPSAGAMEELEINPGGKKQPKASKKASKKPDDGYKFYGKEGTGLGDFSRKHGMQYATQKQFEKDFNMDDGEKAGGRPGRGKLKTQGMNKAGKRKAGFSGRGSGAALRGF